MALARSRRDSGMNYWPGFVDALSTLMLGIIFLLTVFVVAQFFLSQEITGKDTALARLNAQISQLTDLLSLEQAGKTSLEDEIARLRASLSAVEGERDRLRGARRGAPGGGERQGRGRQAQLADRPRKGGNRARASRRSRFSTSRSPRCAASSPRSKKRSTPPRRRTRNRSRASPISASG